MILIRLRVTNWCRRLAFAVFWSIIGGAALRADPVPPPRPPSFLITAENAYGLLPPELVAAPVVTQYAFSSDGRFILLVRQIVAATPKVLQDLVTVGPPREETSLVLWDGQTHVGRELWRRTGAVEEIDWIPRTHVALALVHEPVPPAPGHPETTGQTIQSLLRISGDNGKSEILGATGAGGVYDVLQLSVSPVQPLAILQRAESVEEPAPANGGTVVGHIRHGLYVIGTDGRIGPTVMLPEKLQIRSLEWTQDGSPVLNGSPVLDAGSASPDGKTTASAWYALDPRSAQVHPLDKAPGLFAPPAAVGPGSALSDIRVKFSNTVAKEGETAQSVGLLWLESAVPSSTPRALICGDSTGGRMLPDGSAVLYFSQGGAWVAPLLRMSRQQFLETRRAAARTVVISNAKQLGLAVLMYAQDHDDVLPDPQGVNGKVQPYIGGSDTLLADFVYTYPGGKIPDVANPAETELGYVTGPGGSAVVYADGHVAWRND